MKKRSVDRNDNNNNKSIVSNNVEKKKKKEIGWYGIDDDSNSFHIQFDTVDSVASAMFNPYHWSFISIITLILAIIPIYKAIFAPFDRYIHMSIYLCFRLFYNFGLGILLKWQSSNRSVTKWYQKIRRTYPKDSIANKLLNSVIRSHIVNKNIDLYELPDEFSAWLMMRSLIDLILVNSEVNFFVCFYVSFKLPSHIDMILIGRYIAGLFLCWLSLSTKLHAHLKLGDFGWYWGDFFFRKIQNLTFDGIFQMFPHPMYTVGYLYYYGCTLMAQSYSLFMISIIGQGLQMLFLFIVEEPHIQKMYGGDESNDEFDDVDDILYDPKTGYFPPSKKTPITILKINPLRSGDMIMLILIIYSLVSCYYMSTVGCVIQVIVWRCIHWGGLGRLLYLQSKRRAFTNYFVKLGQTEREAFANWQTLYNISVTLNVVVFVGCALKYLPTVYTSFSVLLDPFVATRSVIGILLIMLSIYTFFSIHNVIGDYGWYYGDFFIPNEKYQSQLVYNGVYRFVNNPDLIIGYLGFYGLAIMMWNSTLFVLAAASQCANIIFTNTVEIPHLKTLYQDSRRSHSALSRSINSKLDPLVSPVKLKAKKVHIKAMNDFHEVYTEIASLTNRVKRGLKRKVLNLRPSPPVSNNSKDQPQLFCPAHVKVGDSFNVKYICNPQHDARDWIGLYPANQPTVRGVSQGRWLYVPLGGKGTIEVPGHMTNEPGNYEIRYHEKDGYDVKSIVPINIIN